MADLNNDYTIPDSQCPSQRLAKLPHCEKSHRPKVDLLVFLLLVASYMTHFSMYSNRKTNIMQLVLEKVW